MEANNEEVRRSEGKVNKDNSRRENGDVQVGKDRDESGGGAENVQTEGEHSAMEGIQQFDDDDIELDYSEDVSENFWRVFEKKVNMVRIATEVAVSKYVPIGKRREDAMMPNAKSLEELKKCCSQIKRNCVDTETMDALLKYKVFSAQKLYDIVECGSRCAKVVSAAKLLVGEMECEDIVQELGKKAMLDQDVGRELGTYDCDDWPTIIAAEKQKAAKCYDRCMELERENDNLKGGIRELRSQLQVTATVAAADAIPPKEQKELLHLDRTPGSTPTRTSEYPTNMQMDFIDQCGTNAMFQRPPQQARRTSPSSRRPDPQSSPPQRAGAPPPPPPLNHFPGLSSTGGNASQGNYMHSNGHSMWYNNAQTHNTTNTSVMEMLLRANITPDVGSCEDGRIDKFDAFIRMFEAKYGFFGDSEKRDYLTARFKGKVAHIYEGLSKEVREGSYYGIVSGIRKALKGDERMAWQKSQERLKHLTAEPGRLRRYCEELERLTSIVHDESGPVGLSKVRASELWTQLRSSPMGMSLLETYENTDPLYLYGELKTKALRLQEVLVRPGSGNIVQRREYSGNSAQGHQGRGYRSDFSHNRNITLNRRPGTFGQHDQGGRDQLQQRVHGQGHWSFNRNANGSSTNTHSEMRCYNCNGLGHTSRFCTTPHRPQNSTNISARGNNDSNKFGRPFQQVTHMQGAPPLVDRRVTSAGANANVGTVTHLVRSAEQSVSKDFNAPVPTGNFFCNAIERDENANELYGRKFLTGANFLNMTTEVLIDSGAQPSIMPLEFMSTADRSGIDLAVATELVNVESSSLIDASGGLMRVVCVVRIPIKLTKSGREASIVFHVVKQGIHAAREPILGTNAFEALGIEVHLRRGNDQEVVKDSSEGEGAIRLRPSSGRREDSNRDDGIGSNQSNVSAISLAKICRRVVVEPKSEGRISMVAEGITTEGDFLLESFSGEIKCMGLGDRLIRLGKGGLVEMPVYNPTGNLMIFRKHQTIGSFAKVEVQETKTVGRVDEVVQMLDEGLNGRVIDKREKETKFWDLIDSSRDPTLQPIAAEVRQVLKDYIDVFAVEDSELRQTTVVQHQIDTGDAVPIRQRVRPVPFGIREKFRDILKGLLEKGIVEHSSSPWASPIVLVKKKDGTIRLCIDYRELNKVIKLDAYPLPSIDSILQQLKGKRYFSSFDLHSGFWQVGLEEGSKAKTAFISPEGLYQFKVLPFGLATSPSTFQRLMDTVLKEHVRTGNVFVYVDDILICTDSVEEHVIVMRKVLEALRKANLAVKTQKCRIFEPRIPYLGHEIDIHGVHPDPKKVQSIKDYKDPTDVAELRTFLGLAGYYRKFVFRFATIAKPLHDLTSKNKPWVWGKEEKEALESLKSVLTKAPILAQPDMLGAMDGSNPFLIYTDACGTGIGGVLSQKGEDGFLHPICFTSKGLTAAERRYHVTDLEALALVYTLQKFQHFIYGSKGTIVRTDHQPLTSLFKRTLNGRLLRWSMQIQSMDVKIEYVKGSVNVVADALSRGIPVEEQDGVDENLAQFVVCSVNGMKEGSWASELAKDDCYSDIIGNIQRGEEKNVQLSNGMKVKTGDFELTDQNLWIWVGERKLKVVPKSMRRKVFDEVHSGQWAGHLGPKKLIKMLKREYFWECLARDVEKWHKECTNCYLENNKERLIPPLKPWVTSKPYELVGIDIMELGRTTAGNRYLLVLIDHFSKWVGAYPIPDKTALTVAEIVVNRWIGEGGRWPHCFLSDQGNEFMNQVVDGIKKLAKIDWVTTKGYNPRENGITERVNATLQRALRKRVDCPSEWDRIVPFVVYSYNTTPHESTGESPFFLLHGFDPRLVTQIDEPEPLTLDLVDRDDYKVVLIDSLTRARELAKERNDSERKKMKEYYDNRNNVDLKVYPKIGERVYMKMPGEKAKLDHPKLSFGVSGPYRVLETSDNSALITEIAANKEPIRVQFDLLVKIPDSLHGEIIVAKTKRGRKARKVAQITSTDIRDTVSVVNSMYFRQEQESPYYHPLHPQFRCTDADVNIGGATVQCCKWQDISCRKVEGVQWQGIGNDSPFGRESPRDLLDLARRIQLQYGGQTLESELKDHVRSRVLLGNWALAGALRTARLCCAHVAAALSLLDVGLGSAPSEVEQAWKDEGAEWKDAMREFAKPSLRPEVDGEDLVFIPKRLQEMRDSMSFPGGTVSPKGHVLGMEDVEHLASLLERRKIRTIFLVLSSHDEQKLVMETIQMINRMLYTWNNMQKQNIRGIVLSPPVIGSVTEYNDFHAKLGENFRKWISWREEEGRDVCVKSFAHCGELEVKLSDYFVSTGILPERTLTKNECFTFVKGLRSFLRSCGLYSCFDVAHTSRAPAGSVTRDSTASVTPRSPPFHSAEHTRSTAARGHRGSSRGYRQWKSDGRGGGSSRSHYDSQSHSHHRPY